MVLVIQRRAEIALRSLQTAERKQVERSLRELFAVDREALRDNQNLHAVRPRRSGQQLFVYKATPNLRLVVSFPENDTCLVQDIVDHSRLDRLLDQGGQE